jgi:transposase
VTLVARRRRSALTGVRRRELTQDGAGSCCNPIPPPKDSNYENADLVRFGIRNFNPTLRKATERLNALCTPEGVSLPPNTLAELRRDMARLRFVMDQINQIEAARLQRLEQAPAEEPYAKVRLLARVIGVGLETADMLVHEILSRKLRDRRAVARYASLTGAPDESGSKRREKGIRQGR